MRRRYRTIHVAQLDRPLAEGEAIRRALAAGARWARIETCERIVDQDGAPVWEFIVRVSRRRQAVIGDPDTPTHGGGRKASG